jgi:predicted nucleotidyltransferase
LTDELEKVIQKAADVLRSFGATDVYLFGSVAKGTHNDRSDIDLAVSGIPPEFFFKAMGTTMNTIKREFDLVELDEKNLFVDYLKSQGKPQRVI